MRTIDNLYIKSIYQRPSLADSFAAELNNFIYQPYFAQFNYTTNLETLDFKLAFKTIKEVTLI